MASKTVAKSLPEETRKDLTPNPYEIQHYARKRIERNVERLRMLSDLTDVIPPNGDTDPLPNAFAALIDAVADDLEKLTASGEEVSNEKA